MQPIRMKYLKCVQLFKVNVCTGSRRKPAAGRTQNVCGGASVGVFGGSLHVLSHTFPHVQKLGSRFPVWMFILYCVIFSFCV